MPGNFRGMRQGQITPGWQGNHPLDGRDQIGHEFQVSLGNKNPGIGKQVGVNRQHFRRQSLTSTVFQSTTQAVVID